MMFNYSDAFKVGDRVRMARTKDEGRAYEGKIVAIWQGEPFAPFAWPFLIKYEAPLWSGEYVEDWAGPHELTML